MYSLALDLQKDLDPTNNYGVGYDLDKEIQLFFSNLYRYIPFENYNRLRVLANAYLPNNNLKFRLMAIGGLFSELALSLETQSNFKIIEKYKGKIPKPEIVSNFILILDKDLIKEMNLGFDGMTNNIYKKYIEDEFLTEIGLK